jgi:hypothetical protein
MELQTNFNLKDEPGTGVTVADCDSRIRKTKGKDITVLVMSDVSVNVLHFTALEGVLTFISAENNETKQNKTLYLAELEIHS